MNLVRRIKDTLNINGIIAILEKYQKAEMALPQDLEPILHQERERYLSALTNIRARMINSRNDEIFNNFSTAYFNIINHGVSQRILTRKEHDDLVTQLVDTYVPYLNRRK